MSDTLCTVKGCERPRHLNLTMCYDHNRAMRRSTSAAYRAAERERDAARKEQKTLARRRRNGVQPVPCARCGTMMDTKRWEHCMDCRAVVRVELAAARLAAKARVRQMREDGPPVDPSRGSVWDIERGKPAGMCITPGCKNEQYDHASRCKWCVNEQKRTPRHKPNNQLQLGPDEENLPRRVSKKQPVLPYSFRAFTWKGTLSEELRNSR